MLYHDDWHRTQTFVLPVGRTCIEHNTCTPMYGSYLNSTSVNKKVYYHFFIIILKSPYLIYS